MQMALILVTMFAVVALVLGIVTMFQPKKESKGKEDTKGHGRVSIAGTEQRERLEKADKRIAKDWKKSSENPFLSPVPAKRQDGVDTYPVPSIAVLVLCYNRPAYLNRTLSAVFRYLPNNPKLDVIVSQDLNETDVTNVIHSFPVSQHFQKLDRKEPDIPPCPEDSPTPCEGTGTYYVAEHYRFALNKVFNELGYEAAIIIEDDLDLSPDFFEYFLATYPMLNEDKSLYCVSAYNDHGQHFFQATFIITHKLVVLPATLYRSDFFPGLGWMLTQQLWQRELQHSWPDRYWDEWMRTEEVRMGRHCIRPEISRSKTFGEEGINHGQFYLRYLRGVRLFNGFVRWRSLDLSYLYEDNFDYWMEKMAKEALLIEDASHQRLYTNTTLKRVWRDEEEFRVLANGYNLLPEFKNGIPRGSYKGLLPFRYLRNTILLIQHDSPFDI
ncbi:UDP-N-acetylglucosamine catabolic process [Balamuthia mandrillaris]